MPTVPVPVLVGQVQPIMLQQGGHTLLQRPPEPDHYPSDIDRGHIPLGREHEGMLIADTPVGKDRVINGVVKGLGNLKVGHTTNQLRIDPTGLGPELEIREAIIGYVGHIAQGFQHLFLVQINAAGRDCVHHTPLGLFKAGARCQGDVLKFGEIGSKTIQNGSRQARLFVHDQIPTQGRSV